MKNFWPKSWIDNSFKLVYNGLINTNQKNNGVYEKLICDPHISQIGKIWVKFCTMVLDLYVSTYTSISSSFFLLNTKIFYLKKPRITTFGPNFDHFRAEKMALKIRRRKFLNDFLGFFCCCCCPNKKWKMKSQTNRNHLLELLCKARKKNNWNGRIREIADVKK